MACTAVSHEDETRVDETRRNKSEISTVAWRGAVQGEAG